MIPSRLFGLVLVAALVRHGRRQVDRLLRRRRRLQHLRLRGRPSAWCLVLRDLVLRRGRVERDPARLLEVHLDPGMQVVAGGGEGARRRPLRRPGRSPSRRARGSRAERAMSAIATAYCSSSPIICSPPISVAMRSAPWPARESASPSSPWLKKPSVANVVVEGAHLLRSASSRFADGLGGERRPRLRGRSRLAAATTGRTRRRRAACRWAVRDDGIHRVRVALCRASGSRRRCRSSAL